MGKAEDLAVFRNLLDEYATALNAQDLSRVTSFWTDEVISMPTNQPTLAGKETHRAWLQKLFDQFVAEVRFPILEDVEVVGDWGFARLFHRIKLTPKAGGASTEENSRVLSIVKRAPDGSWKFHCSIWNSDKPLPG